MDGFGNIFGMTKTLRKKLDFPIKFLKEPLNIGFFVPMFIKEFLFQSDQSEGNKKTRKGSQDIDMYNETLNLEYSDDDESENDYKKHFYKTEKKIFVQIPFNLNKITEEYKLDLLNHFNDYKYSDKMVLEQEEQSIISSNQNSSFRALGSFMTLRMSQKERKELRDMVNMPTIRLERKGIGGKYNLKMGRDKKKKILTKQSKDKLIMSDHILRKKLKKIRSFDIEKYFKAKLSFESYFVLDRTFYLILSFYKLKETSEKELRSGTNTTTTICFNPNVTQKISGSKSNSDKKLTSIKELEDISGEDAYSKDNRMIIEEDMILDKEIKKDLDSDDVFDKTRRTKVVNFLKSGTSYFFKEDGVVSKKLKRVDEMKKIIYFFFFINIGLNIFEFGFFDYYERNQMKTTLESQNLLSMFLSKSLYSYNSLLETYFYQEGIFFINYL